MPQTLWTATAARVPIGSTCGGKRPRTHPDPRRPRPGRCRPAWVAEFVGGARAGPRPVRAGGGGCCQRRQLGRSADDHEHHRAAARHHPVGLGPAGRPLRAPDRPRCRAFERRSALRPCRPGGLDRSHRADRWLGHHATEPGDLGQRARRRPGTGRVAHRERGVRGSRRPTRPPARQHAAPMPPPRCTYPTMRHRPGRTSSRPGPRSSSAPTS